MTTSTTASITTDPAVPHTLATTNQRVMVHLNDVHVYYKAYEDQAGGLKARVAQGMRRRAYRTIRAVQGVTLDLYSAETLGLIGANGSGKSTLLAAMTGLLPLESGTITGRARPALLGVASVLRPALSGRRNIVIGALALGIPRLEIDDRMDELIDFSGLRDSIDLPMGTYSSGMRARLHFTIATAQVPEILLIDEALAVGDERFAQRSAERLNQVREASGTVVLVTHSMDKIRELCDRVAWLDAGKLQAVGDPDKTVNQYIQSQQAN